MLRLIVLGSNDDVADVRNALGGAGASMPVSSLSVDSVLDIYTPEPVMAVVNTLGADLISAQKVATASFAEYNAIQSKTRSEFPWRVEATRCINEQAGRSDPSSVVPAVCDADSSYSLDELYGSASDLAHVFKEYGLHGGELLYRSQGGVLQPVLIQLVVAYTKPGAVS